MARKTSEAKSDWIAREVAKAVNAGRPVEAETVDFSDAKRPLTCLEVDFPILPINQIASIEGNAGKPIYQMSKWWARRRSSVFRSILIAAATKAPKDSSKAAKAVWDAYYGNHQKKGAFKHLKVADIFMGGGTTVVEGSRLGMQMYGNDLNPVAWFVVKNAMAKVDKAEVEKLLLEIEQELKPQLLPFYACDCPRGHKGQWRNAENGKVADNPLNLIPEERKAYKYEGPEVIYVFWAKHVPCQVTGCGHRTPIMSSPVVAFKELSVKYWTHKCEYCKGTFDIEAHEARMAPGVEQVVVNTEGPYAVLDGFGVTCPLCGKREKMVADIAQKSKKKSVSLSLLVHPAWLKGEAGSDTMGTAYGGSVEDGVEATIRWNKIRAAACRLVEVRGTLPAELTCKDTSQSFKTGEGGSNIVRSGIFACGKCGTSQPIVDAVARTGKTCPVSMFAVQGYCPQCDKDGVPYSGRFFSPVVDSSGFDAASVEWESRKAGDLKKYWPTSEIPFGHMTHQRQPLPQHGYTHWWKMFNARQLLVHAQLMRSIHERDGSFSHEAALFVLGGFQQYLRNQVMFTIWNPQRDTPEPMFSNNNFHPKSTMVENCVFPQLGRGNWASQAEILPSCVDWLEAPWELVSTDLLSEQHPAIKGDLKGKSEKAFPGDPVLTSASLSCVSSTNLSAEQAAKYDLVITDPPFGGLLHYSELSDFFYVWLRLVLKEQYPDYFLADYTPKTLEAVANKARQPEDPDGFYKRVLTDCWKESYRILKPGGLLAFTFHHSEDAPWVSVLESLFDAGFYLEATYPIRSDETKGTGQFGSKMIEYDIIHVCRKRTEEPTPISWAKMRRQVLQDVHRIKDLLEHHHKEGLPEADLQVIRRGKALEYFSRHYGKVYKDEDTPITVLEALVGINQLLDEDAGGIKEPPPHNAEPFTRMFLRLFDAQTDLARDQMQKFLRGTGSAPSDFVDRGWCEEKSKVFHLVPPVEIARNWHGRHRKGMTSDYDQAAFFIGACTDGSGINANETLNNPTFKPHAALGTLLTWQKTHGATTTIRNAAVIASQLFKTWEAKNQTPKILQLKLFFAEEGE